MSWRELLAIHPACALLPRMAADELRDLADDIKKNGLKKKIDLVRLPGRSKVAVLDGISRLDALEVLGREISLEVGGPIIGEVHRLSDAEAAAYVISVNIKRRHLTQGQKRELVAELLKLNPEKSDRQIAKPVGVHHETVGAVRTKLEGRGEIRHVEFRIDAKGREQPAKKPVTIKAATERISLPAVREKSSGEPVIIYGPPPGGATKAAPVMDNRAIRLAVLKQAERDLAAWEARYADLGDLCEMVRVVRVRLVKMLERDGAGPQPAIGSEGERP